MTTYLGAYLSDYDDNDNLLPVGEGPRLIRREDCEGCWYRRDDNPDAPRRMTDGVSGHHCIIAPPVWVHMAGWSYPPADYPCASYLAIENVRAKLVEWGHQEKPQFDKDGFQVAEQL